MRDRWREAHHLLCVRLDGMGDMLMTTPAIRALKSSGRCRIAVLTSKAGAQAAHCIPEIDEVIVHEAPWLKSSPPGEGAVAELRIIAELRRRRFDAAVIFTVFSQNPLPAAYLCHLAEIPRRAAYCRENPYRLLSDWIPEVDEAPHSVRHEVRRQLELVGGLGFETGDQSLSLVVPERARRSINSIIRRLGLGDASLWALIHPGASASSRRYPPEYFAVAANLLGELDGRAIVFTGGGDEVDLVESIRARMRHPSISLAGQLSVEELFGVIERAPLLVTNNTGPAHAAAALGTPVVVTYAQTNLQHTPWTAMSRVLSHDVPCRFCLKSVCPEGHHNCLRLVPPESVAHAALELLTTHQQESYRFAM
jgi:lipopolysaccharide heptosyltransferase II